MGNNEKNDQENVLKITQLLQDYPTVDEAMKVKGFHSILYFIGVLGFFVLAQYCIFGFDININLLAASSNVDWLNYVLATLCAVGMLTCMIKAISIPMDIESDLDSDELQNVLLVAKYNSSVGAYIEAKSAIDSYKPLAKRDYYYLNIDKQLAIISNVEGYSNLKKAMEQEPIYVPTALDEALKEFKIAPYTPIKAIQAQIRAYKKKAIGTASLFVGIILLANIIEMPFTPMIRGTITMVCLVLFLMTMYFVMAYFRMQEVQESSISRGAYKAIADLCRYNPEVRNYVALVLQEGRYLNESDVEALSVGRQAEKLKYFNLINSGLRAS